MTIRLLKIVAVGFMVAQLAACASPNVIPVDIAGAETQIESGIKTLSLQAEQGAYSKHAHDWVGAKKVERDIRRHSLLNQTVRLYSAVPLDINEVGAMITSVSGVAVTFNPDVFVDSSTGASTPSIDSTGNGGFDGDPFALALGSPSLSMSGVDARHVDYEGALYLFLDKMTSERNLSWHMNNDDIVIERYVTRIFHLDAFLGTTKQTLTLGQDSQTTTIEQTADVWGAAEEIISELLSKEGRVTFSRSTGTIIVTDSPVNLDRVAMYIKQENVKLTGQVSIEIKILAISSNDEENLAFDLNELIYQGSKLGFNFKSQSFVASGESSEGQVSVLSSSSGFDGSSAIIQAIERAATVTDLRTVTLRTLNNNAVPLDVTSTQAYIESASTTTSGTAGTTSSSIEQGEVTTGLLMSMLPRILEDDRILLQHIVDISTLDSLASEESGNQRVQTPETSQNSILQRLIVKSGEVIALVGFSSVSASSSRGGTISRDNWILGGGRSDQNKKATLLILITPKIIKG